jgi:hypothetical protein
VKVRVFFSFTTWLKRPITFAFIFYWRYHIIKCKCECSSFYGKESHKWGTFFLNNIGVGTRMDDELKGISFCKIKRRKIPSVFWRIIHNT